MARSEVGGELSRRRGEFDDWVAPHLLSLRRYAVAVDPGGDPDDVVQDALERAWVRWETYTPGRGSPRTWLLALVGDKARRRRARAPKLSLVELDPLTPDRDMGDPSERLDVRAAIDRLSTRQRQAVILFYYVDLSVDDVAAAMGCAAGTVKSTLADARVALAALLKEKT